MENKFFDQLFIIQASVDVDKQDTVEINKILNKHGSEFTNIGSEFTKIKTILK